MDAIGRATFPSDTVCIGRDAVSPGDWRHEETEAFIEWASHYDDATREGRHLAWVDTVRCPVLRLDGTLPVGDLVEQVVRSLPA